MRSSCSPFSTSSGGNGFSSRGTGSSDGPVERCGRAPGRRRGEADWPLAPCSASGRGTSGRVTGLILRPGGFQGNKAMPANHGHFSQAKKCRVQHTTCRLPARAWAAAQRGDDGLAAAFKRTAACMWPGASLQTARRLLWQIRGTRYHGVFAPHSRFTAAIAPAHRGTGALKQPVAAGDSAKPATPRHVAMSWARLKRVFGIEIENYAGCGG